jgi:hypothetical protein
MMNKTLEKIFTFFGLKPNSNEITICNGDNTVTLIQGAQRIPIHISINNDTIEIQTPLNIVINSELFAVKTSHGIHLNPPTLHVEEMTRTFLEQQNVIDMHERLPEPIKKEPYKFKHTLLKSKFYSRR